MAKPTQSGSITIVSVSTESIRIQLTAISGATSYQVAYRPADSSSMETVTTYGLTCIISGLEPNTKYVVNYRAVNADGYGPFMATGKTVTTQNNAPVYEAFDWTYAGRNRNGTPVYGSEKLVGYGIYITAAEWNDLAELVSEVTGRSVPTVNRGDPISAYVVNTMARALNVSTVSSGSPITAAFFNRLKNAYNAKIQ